MDSEAQAREPLYCPHCRKAIFPDDSLVINGYKFGREGITTPSGEHIALRPAWSRMLLLLASHPGRLVTVNNLHDAMYGGRADGGPEPKIISVFVCQLRRVFRINRLPFHIRSYYTVGYGFFETVTNARATPSTEHSETLRS